MRKDEDREQIRSRTLRSAITLLSVLVAFCLLTASTWAQSPPSTLSGQTTGRTITAIGYELSGGGTIVDLKSGLIASASGYAKVQAKSGITRVEARTEGLVPPLKRELSFSPMSYGQYRRNAVRSISVKCYWIRTDEVR